MNKKKIDNLTVEVRYTVNLSDVELPENVYSALEELWNYGVDTLEVEALDEPDATLVEWLSKNIHTDDAPTHYFELLDVQFPDDDGLCD